MRTEQTIDNEANNPITTTETPATTTETPATTTETPAPTTPAVARPSAIDAMTRIRERFATHAEFIVPIHKPFQAYPKPATAKPGQVPTPRSGIVTQLHYLAADAFSDRLDVKDTLTTLCTVTIEGIEIRVDPKTGLALADNNNHPLELHTGKPISLKDWNQPFVKLAAMALSVNLQPGRETLSIRDHGNSCIRLAQEINPLTGRRNAANAFNIDWSKWRSNFEAEIELPLKLAKNWDENGECTGGDEEINAMFPVEFRAQAAIYLRVLRSKTNVGSPVVQLTSVPDVLKTIKDLDLS